MWVKNVVQINSHINYISVVDMFHYYYILSESSEYFIKKWNLCVFGSMNCEYIFLNDVTHFRNGTVETG